MEALRPGAGLPALNGPRHANARAGESAPAPAARYGQRRVMFEVRGPCPPTPASRGASPRAPKIYRRARELPRKTDTRPDGLLNKTVSFAPADLVPGGLHGFRPAAFWRAARKVFPALTRQCTVCVRAGDALPT
jgi:hypothetical protein